MYKTLAVFEKKISCKKRQQNENIWRKDHVY